MLLQIPLREQLLVTNCVLVLFPALRLQFRLPFSNASVQ
jgi:hypothetical protein